MSRWKVQYGEDKPSGLGADTKIHCWTCGQDLPQSAGLIRQKHRGHDVTYAKDGMRIDG